MKLLTACLIVLLSIAFIQSFSYAGVGGYEPIDDTGEDSGTPTERFLQTAFLFTLLPIVFCFLIWQWLKGTKRHLTDLYNKRHGKNNVCTTCRKYYSDSVKVCPDCDKVLLDLNHL